VPVVHRFNIDFMGKRYVMFGFSALLLVVAIGALLVNHLQFGIEFRGGTVVDVANAKGVDIGKMRAALSGAGIAAEEIQTTSGNGFIIRTGETDPKVANEAFAAVAKKLGLASADVQVTTIGPGWGRNVTDRSLVALAVSIVAILLYISVRFSEWKMAIAGIVALVHDIVITLGIYALFKFEVTPNTIAALLTIIGFSLYDTIVVFHRIKENSANLSKTTFLSMANESINEVLVRSINTTVTALMPVIVMLLFGGETLKDFSFALAIGLFVGAYSSIGVAAPMYSVWKSAEPKYAALAKKYGSA
jgi:SecD/SecF fusion protein